MVKYRIASFLVTVAGLFLTQAVGAFTFDLPAAIVLGLTLGVASTIDQARVRRERGGLAEDIYEYWRRTLCTRILNMPEPGESLAGRHLTLCEQRNGKYVRFVPARQRRDAR